MIRSVLLGVLLHAAVGAADPAAFDIRVIREPRAIGPVATAPAEIKAVVAFLVQWARGEARGVPVVIGGAGAHKVDALELALPVRGLRLEGDAVSTERLTLGVPGARVVVGRAVFRLARTGDNVAVVAVEVGGP